MNYQIVKKFALELRPIELNVIMNNEGEGIYLYDSSNPIKIMNTYQNRFTFI